ncbi:glycoside hydrolase family 140 protein [Flavisolibacter sp. BT320]|nr:glycoside hydrolase family 140 protein [Flavisolibacter longurius]
MLRLALTCFCLIVFLTGFTQLKVSQDKRYLVTVNNQPFFWLGDTAWELFHRLNRQEADLYLQDRAKKGFTVIQAVVLAELDGLNTPNPYGDRPLQNNDPAKPNEAYFRHVDYIVNRAEKLGLMIGMLPSWGDKWNKKWGVGPEIFTPENVKTFGEFLGRRYKSAPIVWILGGDRDIENEDDKAIIRAMAEGLRVGDGGTHLMTFHPQGGKSSSDFFPDESWIDFHMSQTGHDNTSKNYRYNQIHRELKPVKPHVDGEPRYEDHPSRFNPSEHGWMDDFDARQTAYWSLLSGAFGHTYGNHNIWQFYTENKTPVSWARTHWKTALSHAGSYQVGLARKVLEKRAWQNLFPDQSLIVSENKEDAGYTVAAVSKNGDFMMAYLPYGRKITLNTAKLSGSQLKAWWFNPRDGRSIALKPIANTGSFSFAPHSEGRGSDWLLIIDDAAKKYPDPGVEK